jgi:Integrin-alpha FG-GAP repeat-containing protein 2
MCALRLMDLNGDGQDEIVACWWDGTTLIVDKDRNIATFRFDDRVSAFLCGQYAVHRAHNIPCFVYVTLFGEIVVYHNVRLESVAAKTLMDCEEGSGWDRRELPALYSSILYNMNARDAREHVAALREQVEHAANKYKELLARVHNKNNVN